jgi:hypothetical protein
MKEMKKVALYSFFVASAGIEPASGASEALILSIVLRGRLLLLRKERIAVRRII